MPVLVLNASYDPVNITRARRALVLLIKGVAVIEEAHDRFVHIGLQLPCVIRLRQYRRLPSRIQTLSRKNILVRDGYLCQYCGDKFLSNELELEHVIPRAQGGLSTWENLVAACRDCNARKADRTPDGSRDEAAPSTAPRNDSHLSRFNAPDGSRRGEVEEVSVLLKEEHNQSQCAFADSVRVVAPCWSRRLDGRGFGRQQLWLCSGPA